MALITDKMPDGYLKEMRQLMADISNGDATWAQANDIRRKYSLSELNTDTIRRGALLYSEFNASGWVMEPVAKNAPIKETTTLLNDGTRTSEKFVALDEKELNDKEALLKAHGYIPSQFELLSAKNSIWQQGDGKGGLKNLYASKITVKPIANGLDLDDIKKHFENFKSPRRMFVDLNKQEISQRNDTVFFSHLDVHFGRISLPYETGNEYNIQIAHDNMIKTTKEFIKIIDWTKVGTIIYMVGNDYLNSSFTGYTTSQSHPQDNDGTFNNIFKKGAETLIEVIDMLSSKADVKVVFVSRNHSRFEEFALMQVIEAYYKDILDVEIDSNPYPRKYIKIGNTLLGLTHGSDEKDRINGLMQKEDQEDWGTTKYHYWMCGHLHHNDWALRENYGVSVFTLSAMTKMDNWTVKSGYTMAESGCVAFVFGNEKGLKDIKFFYI